MKSIGIKITAATAVVALTMLTGACSNEKPADPTPKTSATPTATPSPTTEREKAIAAAEAALVRYLKVYDELAKDPAGDIKTLESVAGGTGLALAQRIVSQREKRGLRSLVSATRTSTKVVEVTLANDLEKGEVPTVVLEVCSDARKAQTVDSAGKTVEPDAPNDYPKIRYGLSNFGYPDGERWVLAFSDYDGKASCK